MIGPVLRACCEGRILWATFTASAVGSALRMPAISRPITVVAVTMGLGTVGAVGLLSLGHERAGFGVFAFTAIVAFTPLVGFGVQSLLEFLRGPR